MGPCGGFKNCDNYNDGCNDCICNMETGIDACTKRACFAHDQGIEKCTSCSKGYKLDNDEIECIPECTPEGATFVGDNDFCALAKYSCEDGFEYWSSDNCGCGCQPIEPIITCANVLCVVDTQCFETSLGPKCIALGGVGGACGDQNTELDPICKTDYECVSGTCVNPNYVEPVVCPPQLCSDPCVRPNGLTKCPGLFRECITRSTTFMMDSQECPGCDKFVRCSRPMKKIKKCGLTMCPSGQVCCNPLAGICTPPGGICIFR